MTKKIDITEVTQFDRDGYAEFGLMIGHLSEYDANNVRAGKWDASETLLWFARHRQRITAAKSTPDISLRDQFAGQALPEQLRAVSRDEWHRDKSCEEQFRIASKRSYEAADAMLAAREGVDT